MTDRDLDRHVAGCAAAHQRLLGHLDALVGAGLLDDAAVRGPSRLEGWTVGHVLTHLARNADSLVRVIGGAERGEVLEQYDGGLTSRAADIEAGAPRPAREQVRDVRSGVYALETAWARCSERAWAGRWRAAMGGEQPVTGLVFRRWREVEVHHADLGLVGFGIDDWSPDYVTEDLARRTMEWASRQPMGLTALPGVALSLSPAHRLAWLTGRETPPGLEPVPFA